MNEQDAKVQAATQFIGSRPGRQHAPEMRIEALQGGFVVNTHDGNYNLGIQPERVIARNADELVSLVQRWAREAHER